MARALINKSLASTHTLNLSQQERVQERANRLLERHRKSGKNYTVDFQGIQLKMQSGVFCAAYGDGSDFLAQCISVNSEDRVLDLGTGSGAIGILAARQGAEVVSVDISPLAVTCARENAQLNGLANRIKVYHSNLFEQIQGERFSHILFNPPFMEGKPQSLLEMALYDDEYRHLKHFFKEVSNYLLPNGTILLVFSEAGDIGYLQQLMGESNLSSKILGTKIPEDSGLKLVVYELSQG